MKKAIVFLMIWLVAVQPLFAANAVYVGQSQAGTGAGDSCANQKAATYFNTSGNWSATPTGVQIGPDTTVHLCGTITSNLTRQGNGTSGHPINVVFESGAKMSQGFFSPSGFGNGMLNLNSGQNFVVDGGGTGIIELTDNGTSGTFGHQTDGCGISLQAASDITVHDLTIRNLYVRLSNSDPNGNGYGMCNNNGLGGTTHFYNMTISQMSTCWLFDLSGTNEIDHTTCSGVTWGFADFGTHSVTSHKFHDNTLSDNGEWFSPTDQFHNDPWHIATSGGTWPIIWLYNNTISGDWGTNTTGWFYFECDNTANSCPAKIFNNQLIATSSPTNGRVACKDAQNIEIYNNYFTGPGNSIHIENGGAGGCSGIKSENNIFDTVGTVYAIADGQSSFSTRDYNDYYNSGQAAIGAHDITSNPNLDGNHKPQSGSPVIGAALDLTSLGISALDSDAAGVARPNGAAWDIGAFQFAAGSAPNPPTNVTVRVQ